MGEAIPYAGSLMDAPEAEKRALVDSLARKWVGLKYYDQQRLRGVGGDCTFFVLVYEDAGLIPKIDVPFYSPSQHLHLFRQQYLDMVASRMTERPALKEGEGVGDIVMYKWASLGGVFAHAAIVVSPGWPNIVHGSRKDRMILLGLGDQENLRDAEKRFFTLWP